MSDLIDRQAAIDGKICIRRSNGVEIYDDYVVPVEYLEQLPPAQTAPSQVAADIARIVENGQDMRVIGQERIRGRWIPSSGQCGIKCSECGFPPDDFCYSIDYIDLDYAPNFCPNCGSDNREVTE